MAKAKKTKNAGVITQIIGAVLDIRFQDGDLPEIYDAIHIPTKDGNTLVVEVSQHLGDDTVRCIGTDRWIGARHGSDCDRSPDFGAGRRRDTGTYVQCTRRSDR